MQASREGRTVHADRQMFSEPQLHELFHSLSRIRDGSYDLGKNWGLEGRRDLWGVWLAGLDCHHLKMGERKNGRAGVR